MSNTIDSGVNETENSSGQPKIIEPVSHGALTPGIRIRNLKKTFTVGTCNQRVSFIKFIHISILEKLERYLRTYHCKNSGTWVQLTIYFVL